MPRYLVKQYFDCLWEYFWMRLFLVNWENQIILPKVSHIQSIQGLTKMNKTWNERIHSFYLWACTLVISSLQTRIYIVHFLAFESLHLKFEGHHFFPSWSKGIMNTRNAFTHSFSKIDRRSVRCQAILYLLWIKTLEKRKKTSFMKCMFYWRSDLKIISKIGILYGHVYDQKRNSKRRYIFGGMWHLKEKLGRSTQMNNACIGKRAP